VPRDWTTEALRWVLFAWAMWRIWGGFLLIVICVANRARLGPLLEEHPQERLALGGLLGIEQRETRLAELHLHDVQRSVSLRVARVFGVFGQDAELLDQR
jgi:hypothetical protein